MGEIRKDFKFKVIKNFLTEDEIIIAKKYFIMKHRLNTSEYDPFIGSSWYADYLAETLMLTKLKKMQQETGLELNPTYSYARVYVRGADLYKHKDRPSCEISVTVMVGSSGEPWPIYIDGNKVDLNPGDAAIYLGTELEHWRNEFEGDWHTQMFFHYVDKNGPHKDLLCDSRQLWGSPPIK